MQILTVGTAAEKLFHMHSEATPEKYQGFQSKSTKPPALVYIIETLKMHQPVAADQQSHLGV